MGPPATQPPRLDMHWVTPFTPSCNTAHILDQKDFRVALKVGKGKNVKPDDYVVFLWTNLYHKANNEGEWHAVAMTYQGARQDQDEPEQVSIFMYGVQLILTCLGQYRFTFRARRRTDTDFTWAEDMEVDGHIQVNMPIRGYTVWIQEPIANKITHNIYLGNYTAAIEAVNNEFDCLLNMANDVDIFPEQFTRPIIYKRCPLPFGANNPISYIVIRKGVKWLRYMSNSCKKIMVCSRTGHARSGSIMIAYIYFMNPDLSFEEAMAFVNKRSFVYDHKGLKDTVSQLYPRS